MAFPPRSSTRGRAAGERFALSALRERLDAGSLEAAWRTNPDGMLGRALEIPAGGVVTYPLRLEGPVLFTAGAGIYPHDWRDLRGEVCARVAVSAGRATPRTLWSAPLRTGDRGPAGARALSVEIPAEATALHLSVSPARHPQPGAVRRAIWVDPALWDACSLPASPEPVAASSAQQSRGATGSGDPLFSVLLPVHDPLVEMLAEAVDSVRGQTFGDWELCLVDDGSRDPQVVAALDRFAVFDGRIRLARHPAAGGISAATNTALELASGRYIALLDHDDTLAPDALEHIANKIAAQPELDMIYTDEDTLVDGRQVWAHLKPGWSPDTLRTNGYTCHLGVYRRALVHDLGGFRSDFDGSQDVDMILRLTERTDRIAHIPRNLYHWRAHAASTAADAQSKPYAYVAARNAIASHLQRIGVEAQVDFGPPGLYRVTHRVDPAAAVDLVLAIQDLEGLAEAAASWPLQAHPTWTATLATDPEILDAARAALTDAGIPPTRITTIPTPAPQHPTAALAAAADAGHSDYIVLMQTPAAGLTHDWLRRLIGYVGQPQVAAAGPIVSAADGRIAQAGIAIPEGIPLHLLHGTRSSMDELFGYGTSVYNVSAVSGILATPRDTYEQLGGLDPTYGELTLIDYCLRAGQENQRTVIVPDARLRTTGPDPTTNDLPTLWRLRATWAQHHTHDPYYNPNYRTDRGDFRPVAGV